MKDRKCFKKLIKQRRNKEVSILIGSRRVGKTTLLKQLYDTWGGLFLDIDIFSNYEKVSTYENFINTLKINGYKEGQKNIFFVYLDEFQRYEDLTLVMKNIYDHHNNIKIYASGSSSLTIKNNIQESLAGRKIITHVYPLDFEEFLTFKERPDLIEKVKRLVSIESDQYNKLIPEVSPFLQEFLIYGGYPKVVLSDLKEKKERLRIILDTYIKKDLVDYIHIEKISGCKTLMEILAVNNGMQVNRDKYGDASALDSKTVANYIEILKETFLITVVRPYFSNKNKEIAKMPKIYFMDNGVRNYFCNNFNEPSKRNDIGALFEAYCISEIIKNGEDVNHVKYYRTKMGSEVDIILDRVSEVLPIECKYTKSLGSQDVTGLKTFMKNYKIDKGYLVNLAHTHKVEEGVSKVDCFNLGTL